MPTLFLPYIQAKRLAVPAEQLTLGSGWSPRPASTAAC
jgi:hypothetical protein